MPDEIDQVNGSADFCLDQLLIELLREGSDFGYITVCGGLRNSGCPRDTDRVKVPLVHFMKDFCVVNLFSLVRRTSVCYNNAIGKSPIPERSKTMDKEKQLNKEEVEKVSGGGNDGDEGFPCPCGGTFYVLSDYGRSICYKCNKCGKTLVQGC